MHPPISSLCFRDVGGSEFLRKQERWGGGNSNTEGEVQNRMGERETQLMSPGIQKNRQF